MILSCYWGKSKLTTFVPFLLARALHRILEWKNHGVKWRHHEIQTLDVLNMIVKRINEASVSQFDNSFQKLHRVVEILSKSSLRYHLQFMIYFFCFCRLHIKCLECWSMLLFTVSTSFEIIHRDFNFLVRFSPSD